MVTGGRGLFPGGRSMNDVGGWPTVAGIYTFFAGLAFTGWATRAPAAMSNHRMRLAGRTAHRAHWGYVRRHIQGQFSQSRWYASHPRGYRGDCERSRPARRRPPPAVRPVQRGEPQLMSVV